MKTCQPWPPKTSRVETRGSLRACQVSGGSMKNGGKWRLGMSKRCFFEKGSRSSMVGVSCYEKKTLTVSALIFVDWARLWDVFFFVSFRS